MFDEDVVHHIAGLIWHSCRLFYIDYGQRYCNIHLINTIPNLLVVFFESAKKPCVWTQNKGNSTDNPSSCYREGLRHGMWVTRWADGAVISGCFEDGNPCGEWKWRLNVGGAAQKFLHPCFVEGPWESGMVLDKYINKSVPINKDEYGHTQFDNEYTEIGQLLYNFKYRDNPAAGDALVPYACRLLERRKTRFDLVLPVPPSRPDRMVTAPLAKGLAECLGCAYHNAAIKKNKDTPELKGVPVSERKKLLAGAFDYSKQLLFGKTVLLVDDLFDSGSTLETITEVVYDQGNAKAVHVFAFAKTKGSSFSPADDQKNDGSDFDGDLPF